MWYNKGNLIKKGLNELMANYNDLLLSVNSMQQKVDLQITISEDEVKQQTRRLSYDDKLISDDMLLSLKPETLKSALSDDEYDAFLERYPDYLSESEASSSENTVDEVIVSDEHDSLNSTETSESLEPIEQASETFKDEYDEIEDVDIDEDEIEEMFDVSNIQPVKKQGFEWTPTMTVTAVVVILAILTIIGLITTIN